MASGIFEESLPAHPRLVLRANRSGIRYQHWPTAPRKPVQSSKQSFFATQKLISELKMFGNHVMVHWRGGAHMDLRSTPYRR